MEKARKLILGGLLAWVVSAGAVSAAFALPVEIGFVYYRKPQAAQRFDAYRFGLETAAREINETGGLAGRPVRIVCFDDGGNAARTRKVAEEISKRPEMVAVIGFSNSSRAAQSIRPVSEAGIPILSSAESRAPFASDTKGVFFTTSRGAEDEVDYFLAFARERGYRRAVVVFGEGDEFSREYFSRLSGEFPARMLLSDGRGANVVVSRLQRLLDPDTVIILSLGVEENARLCREIRKREILNEIFLGRGGLVGEEFYRDGGDGLYGIFDLSPLLAGLSNESLSDFGTRHRDYFAGENWSWIEHAVYAYDLVYLLRHSLEGNTEKLKEAGDFRRALLRGLRMVNYEGLSGSFAFDWERRPRGNASKYLLQTDGRRPLPYPAQFSPRGGDLIKIPVVFCYVDMVEVKVRNTEASQYDLEFFLTIRSPVEIGKDDLEFENAVIGAANYTPSIYFKELTFAEMSDTIADVESDGEGWLQVKVFRVRGLFEWGNTIEDFPFDRQSFGLLIRPSDPARKNFLIYFLNPSGSGTGHLLQHITFQGWDPEGLHSGYRQKDFNTYRPAGGSSQQSYYSSSLILTAKRVSMSPAMKFVIPLVIVLLASVCLFFVPTSSGVDKIGASSNLVITIIALYFSYAMLIDVYYVTTLDFMYFGAMVFVFVCKIGLIMQYNYESAPSGPRIVCLRHYRLLFVAEILALVAMVIFASVRIFTS